MERLCLYKLDYAESLLSVFDISGSLFLSNITWQSEGIKHDINQLMKDLDNLEEDYKNAYENIINDQTI